MTITEKQMPKNFCIAPWMYLHMLPNGNLYPCCIIPSEMPNGNINTSSLSDSWNSDYIKKMRKQLLEGEAPPQCVKCTEVDKCGGNSLRKSINQQFSKHFDRALATKEDGSVEAFDPVCIDIRFSNICNFKCRNCGPEYSSSWHKDYISLNPGSNPPHFINALKENESIWEEIEALTPSLEEIYFAGGEPLIMDEHYKLLDLLIKKNKTDIKLIYVTNLSVLKYQKRSITEYWKKFNNLCIGVSLDGMGEKAEYLRKGQVWQETVENIKTIKEELPHAYFYVIHTVSAMNILESTKLYSYLVENNFIGINDFNINFVITPNYLSAKVLPKTAKEAINKHLRDFIDNYISKLDNNKNIKDQFESIINFIQQEEYESSIEEFKKETTALDNIRNENFERVFPEIHSLLK